MQSALGTVLIVVVCVGVLGAVVSFLGSGKLYDQIGRGGLSLGDGSERGGPEPTGAGATAAREDEIRQLPEARNARRRRRGEVTDDVETELSALTRPAVDVALREEMRDLVVARNARRVRRGRPPLDVDAEVERRLAELG